MNETIFLSTLPFSIKKKKYVYVNISLRTIGVKKEKYAVVFIDTQLLLGTVFLHSEASCSHCS